ncbi:hypothetical protein [Ruminococcus flavefaciens]|uniref:hypothetical protein n=1 Tax=Ruminococcus flavefaciens TaxID=1265 RepID=UPI0009425D79|nr:hypothetical protein [Ruminococcus flavefaciens]
MKIKPYVWEVKERIVNISFDMYSDVLKTRFFEFSTGLGLLFLACAELQCDPFAELFVQPQEKCRKNKVENNYIFCWSMSHDFCFCRLCCILNMMCPEQQWEFWRNDVKSMGHKRVLTYSMQVGI